LILFVVPNGFAGRRVLIMMGGRVGRGSEWVTMSG
jgi:hypothetical protein